MPEGGAGQGCAGRSHSVESVGLAHPAAVLPVRRVDLHDRDLGALQDSGQAGAVAAGPFDANLHQLAERLQPPQQLPVPFRCRRERRGAEQSADPVQGCGDVHVEMGVDATGDEPGGDF